MFPTALSTGRPRFALRLAIVCLAVCSGALPAFGATPFQLPTANRALFEPGGEERFFVGTVGKTWTSGQFGCVRSEGWQMHEGMDIRCLSRDRKGEPTDPVLATADGVVAYINARAALSTFGLYVILRHQIENVEIYSLYAHLRQIKPGLAVRQSVRAGEAIGTMGRTANTLQAISKERAHLHFELNLLINDRFAAWYKKFHRGERNDHGDWNGQNLIAIDPRAVLMGQRAHSEKFSLVQHLTRQPELCRVLVRRTEFPWLRRYPFFVRANPAVLTAPVAGYEIALGFNGLPVELVPRTAAEIKGKEKFQLLSVTAAEYQRNPCRRLVSKDRRGRWQLASRGQNLLELLTY